MYRLSDSCRRLLQTCQENAPVNLRELANKMELKIFNSPLPPDTAGTLSQNPENNQWEIRVNQNDCPARKRFTIAHEIAHFLLHREAAAENGGVTDNVFYRSALSSPMEREANEMAADILMPWSLINQLTAEGYRTPQELAEQLNVSLTAMNIRLGIPT